MRWFWAVAVMAIVISCDDTTMGPAGTAAALTVGGHSWLAQETEQTVDSVVCACTSCTWLGLLDSLFLGSDSTYFRLTVVSRSSQGCVRLGVGCDSVGVEGLLGLSSSTVDSGGWALRRDTLELVSSVAQTSHRYVVSLNPDGSELTATAGDTVRLYLRR